MLFLTLLKYACRKRPPCWIRVNFIPISRVRNFCFLTSEWGDNHYAMHFFSVAQKLLTTTVVSFCVFISMQTVVIFIFTIIFHETLPEITFGLEKCVGDIIACLDITANHPPNVPHDTAKVTFNILFYYWQNVKVQLQKTVENRWHIKTEIPTARHFMFK